MTHRESGPTEPARPVLPTRWDRIVLWSIPYVALAIFQALVLRALSYEAFEIEGPSMEPTLVNGDRVVVDKGVYGLGVPWELEAIEHWADPERGDVVILASPMDGVDIVKRVIAVAGDRVEIHEGEVFVDGTSIRRRALGPCDEREGPDCEEAEEGIGERTWRVSYSTLSPTESYPERVVPEGHVFVLGDHRDRSNDSRNPRLGMIPVGRLRGRARLVYFSERTERIGTWVE